MLVVTLSILISLVGISSPAFSDNADLATDVLIDAPQDEAAIAERLADYLSRDDIAGAKAFVGDLAARGVIDEDEQRLLEDRIWRIKTERTLEYARKIREAIRDSDLDTMKAYNARMQRLMAEPGTGSAQIGTVEADADEVEPEPAEATDDAGKPDQEAVIADLVRRAESAIAAYDLTIAPSGKESALDIVDALLALGDDGQAAASTVGREIAAAYRSLIEDKIARGRLDQAATFAERMAAAAERTGVPRSDADEFMVKVDQAKARRRHEQLVRQTEELLDQGMLVAENGDSALATAAEAVRLGVDGVAASRLVENVILSQRAEAESLAEDGKFREAANALEALADALLAAEIGQTTLAIDLRAKATRLTRRADLQDRERERRAVAGARQGEETPPEGDADDEPFTFINPF